MTVTRVTTSAAPVPRGSYSQAVVAHGFLYTCGMAPIDPATGDVVGDDAAAQTDQVMRNLKGLLASQGLEFSDVVKATVHLQDIERDFQAYDDSYRRYFTDGLPVRTTVGSTLLNILVEIDLVAALPENAHG